MRATTFCAILSYITGVILFGNADITYLNLLLIIPAILAIIFLIFCRRFAGIPLIIAFFLALGGYYGAWYQDAHTRPFQGLWDKPVTLTCRIDGLPNRGDGYLLCNARIISVSTPEAVYPLQENIQIRCFTEIGSEFPEYGETVSFKTKLTRPQKAGNDGAFDYARHLQSKGIYACCDAYDYAIFRHGMSTNRNPLMQSILRLKSSLLQQIERYFTGDDRAFIKAAFLGATDEISEPFETGLQRSGLSHLVSISGLHFGILMFLFGGVFGLVPFHRRRLLKLVCYPVMIVFLMAITGFQPSVVRAGIMALFAVAAEGLFREYDTFHSLMLAALLMLLHNPFAIYDLSFLLSFTAVLGIALFSNPIEQILTRIGLRSSWLVQSLSMSLASQVFATPVLLWQFNGVATISVLSNLIAIPLMPFFIYGCMVFLPLSYLWQPLAKLAAGFVFMVTRAILLAIRAISAIPFSYLQLSGRTFLLHFCFLALILSALYILVVYRKKQFRAPVCLSLVIIFSLYLFVSNHATPFAVTCLDVGQGDCQIIHTPGRQTIVIDGGGLALPNSDTAKKHIIPYLYYHGISRVDCAIVTHYHTDHANGIISLLSSFPVKRLILPDRQPEEDSKDLKRQLLHAASLNGTQVLYAESGDSLLLDHNVMLDVISPQINAASDENNDSMVLRLSYGKRRFLFTSDIEEHTEKQLLSQDLACDVLKIAHHGSGTSSSEEFLDAVSPKYAMIGVGENNNHGHPSYSTIYRLQNRNIACYRTDRDGQITFRIYHKDGEIIPTANKEVSAK
ncbi:MAG: DNA internalization-related competence protein ComEC/Rec2 [Ruminococcaceae bacterium]|nr:DNA internalization-related competence protein ComEC/Rec2 [Oscillospiraceae bacterium]